MKIQQIILQGFKSFRNRTVIHFGKGIHGVVGPNGCGKSNIVDALLWVIGETAPAHLRSDSMEDIIFSGSSTRSISGLAEVSLVMARSDKCSFPDPYKNLSELMITRRLDRDGKSEYLINSSVCRLKDVQEIFMDTGVGRGGFSFMEQGAVEQFINSPPEKKRWLIESAAGISKFRLRRKEAKKKLELTQVHLDRLQDVLKEQESQLKKLQKQSERANKFRQLKQQIQNTDIQVSQWHLIDLEKKASICATKRRAAEVEKNQFAKKLRELKTNADKDPFSRRKAILWQEQEKVTLAQQELFAIEKKLAAAHAFLEANTSESKANETNTFASAASDQSLTSQIQNALDQITNLNTDITKGMEQVYNINSEYKKQTQKQNIVTKLWQQIQSQIHWLQDIQNSLVNLKEKFHCLSRALQKEQQVEQLSYSKEIKRSARIKYSIEHYTKEVTNLEEQKKKLANHLSQRKIEWQRVKKQYEHLEQSLEQKQTDIIKQHQQIAKTDQIINEIKLQEAEIASQKTAISNRTQELYQVDIASLDQKSFPSEQVREQTNQELSKYNSQLSRIGEVNLLALAEYKEVEQKKIFHEKQYQDLSDSALQLREVIKRMDHFCSKKFQVVFDQVNHYFSRVFPALFDGGKAELILTDKEGVDVMVEPSGKKIQNMNLLSGGEKAMTALAVIFSLFMVKPSPFCVLDEVDAPLDDANIARFKSLLLEIAAICDQVLVITHNRYTMQICHKLYGVTMEEKGVSKIVSLDMQKASLSMQS